MKKIVVTGGMGFIGSHTVVALQESGFEVIIIDDLSNSNAQVLDNICKITGVKPVFVKMNLCDKEQCARFFQENNGVEGIIHFAAAKAVGESVKEPLFYYRNNLVSLLNILEACSLHHISNFVFSSSCTVYGQPEILPVTESSPRQIAESPYGNTKKIAEDILEDFTKSLEVDTTFSGLALRYFNPIGAHSSAIIGELPIGVPNNLMPYITQTAAGIRPCLNVFGGDYNTPDGTCIRDYIHVMDIAEAHVVALEYLIEKKNKKRVEYYNLGTGNGFSVLEVIKSFERATGEKVSYNIVDRRAGDIEKIWADPSLANQILGWKAKRTLDEMTASAWKWQQTLRQS